MRGVAALLIAACGDDSAGHGFDAGADAGVLQYRACEEHSRVGSFDVDLAAKYTGVQGQVFDGVVPSNVLSTLASEGGCRHARAPVLFCDPACVSGETCDADGQCIPYPVAQDVGTVEITGLLAPVEMEALPPGNFYTNSGSLPHPGFEAGADIALHAEGGVYEPFDLRGFGVDALAVEAKEVVVEAGVAVTLLWTPPTHPGPMRLRIALIVNGHGSIGSRIECEAEDTGVFVIPEALVTQLVNDGLSGFPTLSLSRTTSDTASIASGCVEFRVQSALVLPVSIPGLVSCSDNEDCAPPQTCQSDLTCG